MQHKNGIAVGDIIDKQKVLKILGAVKIKCDCGYPYAKVVLTARALVHNKNCGKKQEKLLEQIFKKIKRL